MENMLRAANMRRVEREYEIHLTAWQNAQVQATETKGTGKNQKQIPVFKKFNDFFNYEQRMNQALGKEVDNSTIDRPQGADDELISAMLKARG